MTCWKIAFFVSAALSAACIGPVPDEVSGASLGDGAGSGSCSYSPGSGSGSGSGDVGSHSEALTSIDAAVRSCLANPNPYAAGECLLLLLDDFCMSEEAQAALAKKAAQLMAAGAVAAAVSTGMPPSQDPNHRRDENEPEDPRDGQKNYDNAQDQADKRWWDNLPSAKNQVPNEFQGGPGRAPSGNPSWELRAPNGGQGYIRVETTPEQGLHVHVRDAAGQELRSVGRYGKGGRIINGGDRHIPYKEWIRWPRWDSPPSTPLSAALGVPEQRTEVESAISSLSNGEFVGNEEMVASIAWVLGAEVMFDGNAESLIGLSLWNDDEARRIHEVIAEYFMLLVATGGRAPTWEHDFVRIQQIMGTATDALIELDAGDSMTCTEEPCYPAIS